MSRDYGTENRNGCKWTNVYTCHLESYDFTSGLQVVMICHGSHFEFITKRHDMDQYKQLQLWNTYLLLQLDQLGKLNQPTLEAKLANIDLLPTKDF